jgi:hypothetical protein
VRDSFVEHDGMVIHCHLIARIVVQHLPTSPSHLLTTTARLLNASHNCKSIVRFSAVRELNKLGKRLIMTTFSQGAPHDSPSNKIEHYWSFTTKRLGGLVIDPCASGDVAIPSNVPGVDAATRLAKTQEVLTNAMDVIESCLLANNELVEGAHQGRVASRDSSA